MRAGTCSTSCWAAGDGTLKTTQSKAGSYAALVSKDTRTAASSSSTDSPHLSRTSSTPTPEGNFVASKPATRPLPEHNQFETPEQISPQFPIAFKDVSSERGVCRAQPSASKASEFERREKSYASVPENFCKGPENATLPARWQSPPLTSQTHPEGGRVEVKAQAELPVHKASTGNDKDTAVAKTEVERVKVGVEEFRRLLYVQMCKTKSSSDVFVEVNSVEATQAALQKYDVDMDKLGSIYPSVGALLHDEGYCIPCAFASKNNKSCHNGVSCCFCHYFHREVLVRRRGKKKRSHNHNGGTNQRSEVV